MGKKGVCISLALVVAACVTSKQYLKDWQSEVAPGVSTQVVELDRFPKAGRVFEVRRTYVTSRESRWNRRTPPEGYIEQLKVADNKGRLEFWRNGQFIHTIWLGECFSFASMDENHDYAAEGQPASFTAPADCRLWDGREWHQTYRTLVKGWVNPCVYEAKRLAKFVRLPDGKTSVRTETAIHLTVEKDGSTHDLRNWVEYDPDKKFFRAFDVGYVGSVQVIREL